VVRDKHCLVMMRVSMKFHAIIFICLEMMMRTTKKAYLAFDLYQWPWLWR